MTKLLTIDDFRASAKGNARPEGAVMCLATSDPQDVAGDARTLRFVFSDGSVDRAGDTIDADGWETDNFLKNPVALWAHDSFSPPIGRAKNIGPAGGKLYGDIEFMPPEVSSFADSIFRMVKGGFIKAVSVGFMPLEWTFVNDKDRPYGIDFKRQELLEISVCPVPCNANALLEARSKGIDTKPILEWAEKLLDAPKGSVWVPRALLEETFRQAKTPRTVRQKYLSKAEDWKCGAARDLPIDDSDSWDGAAAEASIFEHAGGENFDPAKARPGFLIYDASAPKLRGSYKEPFAHVVDGVLKAVKGGIRAAASRLPATDASQSAKDEAKAVIDHYESRMKDGKAMDEIGDEAVVPVGNCGRSEDMECGMKDPAECAIHAPKDKAKRLKAGRRVSQQNADHLNKAMEHIKSVLDSNADDEPDDDDQPDPADNENGGVDDPHEFRSVRDRAKQTLDAARAAQANDLTI